MRYRVSMPEPHSHLFEVEAILADPGPSPVLAMPVWTPGSYLVREFARHVEGIEADDGAGRKLPLVRFDKHRFRVEAGGASQVRLCYRVYANELTVRTAHLDGTHGFFNGANLFLYAEGRVDEPVELTVAPPPGWRVATAMDGGPARFTARDYHELADSPVEVGTHALATFEALGKRHEVAVSGRGHLDLERFAADLKRIVEHLGGLMGGLPYERYLFIVHLTDKRRGGLEHERSTTLAVSRNAFFPRETYEETLALAAHEFLHLWNVKRLRPEALLPYDYAREQYTRLLWWFEGVTSYYDRLTLVRAGLGEVKGWLKHLGEQWTGLSRQPGAGKMSLEEASLTAWVKYYRPDENSPNSAVSYYQKGELVALCLDLALRRAGGSLDDLLRGLHARYAATGLPEDGVEGAVAGVMGEDGARDFFDRFVRGTAPIEAALDPVGLRISRRTAQSLDDKGGTPPRKSGDEVLAGWLGAEVPAGARMVVRTVREGGPAAKGGLYADDEILAESGFRVDRGALWDRMRQVGPGGQLRLTVFRKDELLEIPVTLGHPPDEVVWLEPLPDATPAQKSAFQAWTGAALPER
jgi:predicted metalloprotease with PDZ domain